MDDLVIIGPYRSLDQLKNGKKVALSDEDKKKMQEAAGGKDGAEEKLAEADDGKKDSKDKDQAVAKGEP
jgi:hypothetical protein